MQETSRDKNGSRVYFAKEQISNYLTGWSKPDRVFLLMFTDNLYQDVNISCPRCRWQADTCTPAPRKEKISPFRYYRRHFHFQSSVMEIEPFPSSRFGSTSRRALATLRRRERNTPHAGKQKTKQIDKQTNKKTPTSTTLSVKNLTKPKPESQTHTTRRF